MKPRRRLVKTLKLAQDDDEEEVFFMDRHMSRKVKQNSAFRSLNHVAVTFHCVERFFSRARLLTPILRHNSFLALRSKCVRHLFSE